MAFHTAEWLKPRNGPAHECGWIRGHKISCACAVWLMTVTCVEELSEELLALVATIEKGFGEGIAPGAR